MTVRDEERNATIKLFINHKAITDIPITEEIALEIQKAVYVFTNCPYMTMTVERFGKMRTDSLHSFYESSRNNGIVKMTLKTNIVEAKLER